MTIKLYGSTRSPNVRKVSMLATALDIPLTHVTLDFSRGDLRSPDYLAKNPNGKIPTIDDDGFVLWESAAILRYLAAKRPELGLVPSGLRKQARVDQWLFWWTAHLEPALDRLIYERIVKPFLGQAGIDATIVAEAEATLERFLPILDDQLSSKEHILGKLSIVDFAVSPRLDGIPELLQVGLDPYPNLRAWLERMREKPYWQDA
jgi:glutathione S-transferase